MVLHGPKTAAAVTACTSDWGAGAKTMAVVVSAIISNTGAIAKTVAAAASVSQQRRSSDCQGVKSKTAEGKGGGKAEHLHISIVAICKGILPDRTISKYRLNKTKSHTHCVYHHVTKSCHI